MTAKAKKASMTPLSACRDRRGGKRYALGGTFFEPRLAHTPAGRLVRGCWRHAAAA